MLSGLGRAPGVLAIMGDINQTVMMARSMVIVTSMVGAGGLGGARCTAVHSRAIWRSMAWFARSLRSL